MYDMDAALRHIDQVIAQGPYTDTWESLSHWQPPKWYQNAKFGIFIHWGVYSVPAYDNEWYPRNMYIQGTPAYEHHVKTYGPQKKFGYKDFIPLFRAEKFDPAAWAELFQRAGARYVVPVAEHHDGFQMYQSKLSHWNAGEMGPKRDVVGQLKAAVEDRGMTLGVSSHRIEHWFFMGEGRKFDSDVPENAGRDDLYWPAMPIPENTDSITGEPGPSEEFLNDWLVRTCELIDNYHPRILYFDWWIQHVNAKPYLKKLAAYYYNRAAEWGIEVALNCKYDAFLFGTAVLDIERGQMADIKPYFWQTDTAVALNSWGYTEGNQFRPAGDIIQDLVDIVSKNGCLLLNVGPKSDGTISQEDTQILMEIGDWLAVNGEAIYDTHVWKTFGEGPTQVLRVVYDLVIILLGYAFGAPFAAVTLAMAFLLGPAVSLVGKWLDCWIFLRPASPDSKKAPLKRRPPAAGASFPKKGPAAKCGRSLSHGWQTPVHSPLDPSGAKKRLPTGEAAFRLPKPGKFT